MYIAPKLHTQRTFFYIIPTYQAELLTLRIEGLHTNIDDLRKARGVAVSNLASELRGRCLHNLVSSSECKRYLLVIVRTYYQRIIRDFNLHYDAYFASIISNILSV